MCSDERVAAAKLLIATLNPGGRERHGSSWSYRDGNAYASESWLGREAGASPLQVQIQRMIEFLDVPMEQVAAAYFVPFRSPRWADLRRKDEAIAFSKQLWSEFLPKLRPDYVVCVGRDVGRLLVPLMGVTGRRSVDTGWGSVKLERGELADGSPFIALPHLSTFQLFGKAECEPHLRSAFFGPADASPEQQKWAHHA